MMMLVLEWAGAIGVVASILTYPRNVVLAAWIAIAAQFPLIYVFGMKGLWGAFAICLAGFASHGFNIWREKKNGR